MDGIHPLEISNRSIRTRKLIRSPDSSTRLPWKTVLLGVPYYSTYLGDKYRRARGGKLVAKRMYPLLPAREYLHSHSIYRPDPSPPSRAKIEIYFWPSFASILFALPIRFHRISPSPIARHWFVLTIDRCRSQRSTIRKMVYREFRFIVRIKARLHRRYLFIISLIYRRIVRIKWRKARKRIFY